MIALLAGVALCGGVIPAWGGSTSEGEIVPGKGVGSITVGMTSADVMRLWGPPSRTENSSDGVILFDYGDAKGVGVFVLGERIMQIMVVTQAWSVNGLKIGATRPEVLAFFGPPDEEQTAIDSPGEYRYVYRRRGLAFTFRDRTVAAIAVIPAEVGERPKGLDPDDPALRKPFMPTPGATPSQRY
jgi:hypothetical protein